MTNEAEVRQKQGSIMKLLALAGLSGLACAGVLGFSAAAAGPSAPVNPQPIIDATVASDGTITWTITIDSGNEGHDAEFVLLFPSHPAGSSVTGLPLHIVGNGSASFTQTGAACGGDAGVDLLDADITFSDLMGSVHVDCPTPTTTTTTTATTPPPSTTTTTTTPAPSVPPLANIQQEQQQVVVAPGVTGGNG